MYLNTHSRFSLRYGVLSVDDMLSWAQAAGVTRMALTDVGTTSANWDFVRRAERFGVTPVLGIDVRNGNARRFVALARHAAGYEALCRWCSELNLAGTPFPARLPEDVRAAGVAAIYPWSVWCDANNSDARDPGADPFDLDPLGADEWVGVQAWEVPAVRLARADRDPVLGPRLVALSTATFTCKRDWNTHRLLRAIDHNTLLSRLVATECGDPRDCFRAPHELRDAYAEMPDLMARAEDLLAGCSMTLPEPPEGRLHNNPHTYTESEDEDEEWVEDEDDSSGSSFEMYYKDYSNDDYFDDDDEEEGDGIFTFKRNQFADLVVFDDELTPKQGVNIEKALGDKLRVCDRTALILDIFSQRARTAEGAMQVEIGQLEYQLPRITKLWTHLERQSGSGNVKGMGEKQIEIDKRLLKDKISQLRKKLRAVKTSRDQRRDQNRDKNGAPIAPTIALAGYTNAGKSSLMNALCGDDHARVQDELFHTLDPLTRRLNLPSGGNCRVVDTVGFIQKLPTQLVAAFRATLEEVAEANLVLHVIDISSELATAQMAAVDETLEVLLRERSEKDGASAFEMPTQISVWNKLDNLSEDQRQDVEEAAKRINSKNKSNKVFIVSARTGEGLDELRKGLESVLAEKTLRRVELRVPFSESGKLIGEFRKVGVVEREEWDEENALIVALVPISMSERSDVVGYYSSWVSSFSAPR